MIFRNSLTILRGISSEHEADLFAVLALILALLHVTNIKLKVIGKNKVSTEDLKTVNGATTTTNTNTNNVTNNKNQKMKNDIQDDSTSLFPKFQGQPKYVYTFDCNADNPMLVPNGPNGTCCVVPIMENAKFYGPGLSGKSVGPSADWLTIRADGSVTIDIRMMIKTDDDVLMKCNVLGRSYRDPGNPNNSTIQTVSTFEVVGNNNKYKYLNQKFLFGQGVKTGSNIKVHYFDASI